MVLKWEKSQQGRRYVLMDLWWQEMGRILVSTVWAVNSFER